MTFSLHPQLAADCISIGDLRLCHVLLMNNSHFPWLILVPRRNNKRELFDLEADDYHTLMEEIRVTSQRLAELTSAHKMNVAALGNMVPQLHIHIIARQPDDMAWPQPVWNAAVKAEPYSSEAAASLAASVRRSLALA